LLLGSPFRSFGRFSAPFLAQSSSIFTEWHQPPPLVNQPPASCPSSGKSPLR
jgi:hypothetical protein